MSDVTLKQADSPYLPFVFHELTTELRERAKIELFEDSDTRTSGLVAFRTFIKDANVNFPTDEELYLLKFLRVSKYNVKKAFTLFKNYHESLQWNGVFEDFDFSRIMTLVKSGCLTASPLRDKDGSVIFFFLAKFWDINVVSYDDVYRASVAALEHCSRYPVSQIAGCKIILDYAGHTFQHFAQIRQRHFSWIIRCTQNTLPARIKEVHILNAGLAFAYIWSIVKPVIPKKMKKRVFIHGKSLKTLHDHISLDVLPRELDGNAGPYSDFSYHTHMEQFEDDMTELIQRCLNKQKKVPEDT